MDAFSGEGELLNISTAFHTHAYSSVLSFDTKPLSPQNRIAAQILKYRAQIALGKSREVLSAVGNSKDAASQSIKALAQHSANNAAGLHLATQLAESEGEDPVVQICCGTVLASAGETAKAIELLGKHQGNLEAVALLTQIHLSQNRTDLALKEVQAAKRWAQDSLLINLAEAWVNLRIGGSEKYQSTFYVYEELAGTPSTTSPTSLVGQAVAELHLGRLPEAEAALQQAMQMEKVDPQAIANSIVLASLTGKKSETATLTEQLRNADPEHAFLQDLEAKAALFDAKAANYQPKVAS
jgi:coatomer subunit epsilon